MNFKEFVAIKQAQAIVEHLETLSESQADELLGQLDDATIELIEQILNEVTAGTVKRKERDFEAGKIPFRELLAVRGNYDRRKRYTTKIMNRYPGGGTKTFGFTSPSERGQQRIATVNMFRKQGESYDDPPGDPRGAVEASQRVRKSSRIPFEVIG